MKPRPQSTRREMTPEERAWLAKSWPLRFADGEPHWTVAEMCDWLYCSTKKLTEWVKELGLPQRKPQKPWSAR